MIFYANTDSFGDVLLPVSGWRLLQTLKVEVGTFPYLVLNRLWERERSRTTHRLGCVVKLTLKTVVLFSQTSRCQITNNYCVKIPECPVTNVV